MNEMMKRILSLVLCAVMVLGVMPVSAFATDGTGETAAVVETTEAVVETTEAVVETTEAVTETTQPIVETTQPIVETTEKIVEETVQFFSFCVITMYLFSTLFPGIIM